MTQLSNLVDVMQEIAPVQLAESWDNVGLLVGDPQQRISNVMLTIDYTHAVAREAVEKQCDAIIAYHPPIFESLKRVNAGSLIFDAIRRGIAIYSPHTALDVAAGGTNDVLADVLDLRDRTPLKRNTSPATEFKLVTCVPASAIENVSKAMFDAGAGGIGNYTHCSFRSEGTGTFFGAAGANPTVGRAGQLETVSELRLETVVALDRVERVVSALKRAHPYEQVAFDLVMLAPHPSDGGMGRIGRLPGDATAEMLINRIKRELGISHVLVAGDPSRMVRTAAVCAGSCGKLIDDAIAQKVDFYLTGEMRHHDALNAASRGMTVVCVLHSNSERKTLARLQDRLAAKLPKLGFLLSAEDRDPFAIL